MLAVPLDRVGVVMMSAIGDAVHVLPVLTALKRHHPECRTSWILQPGPASLVRGHPAVDEIIPYDKERGWHALLDVRRELAARPFDIVLDLQVYIKAGLVTALTRAPVKLGFDRARSRDLNTLFTTHRIPPHAPQHVQDQYFEFLTHIGVGHEPVEWGLGPWPHERDWQRDFFARLERPVATLVVGTSHPQKEWVAERWAELVDVLHHEYGLLPVLAGGTSSRERETERAIMERARHRPISALGTTLRELVGLLDGSALVVSLDTAPLHMAVALDRPVISLMGYNNPKRVGPYRRFRDLVVDAYGDPGEGYPVSPEHRRDRMPRIGVRDVVEKVDLWRKRYGERYRGSLYILN